MQTGEEGRMGLKTEEEEEDENYERRKEEGRGGQKSAEWRRGMNGIKDCGRRGR